MADEVNTGAQTASGGADLTNGGAGANAGDSASLGGGQSAAEVLTNGSANTTGANAAGNFDGLSAERNAAYAEIFGAAAPTAGFGFVAGLVGVPGNAGDIRSAYGHSVPGPGGSVFGSSAWGEPSRDGDWVGIDMLRNRLNQKRQRVGLRYEFYEMKNQVRDLGISTPPALRAWNSALGWCANAVDSLADRLVFRNFRDDVFDFNTIFGQNSSDVLTSSAVLSSLISACSFIRVYRGADDEICLESIDGGNATGIIDPRTMLLKEGYCVLSRDELKNPVLEAWLRPHETRYYERGKRIRIVKHSAPWPLLVPVVFRPDAVRPFGHSRISRACMSYTAGALRTIKRSEISAEFYSFPQKYVTGLSRDVETAENWRLSMSSFIKLTVGEDGEVPKFGQFTQQSMEPHLTQLRMFASLFAGETGLTLDDLGFPSENPSSQEAIKAAHENLRRRGKRAQATFGTGLKNAGYLAACLRDDYPYKRAALSIVRPIWEPLFEPDASGLNLIGDGVLKLNQAVADYVTPQMLEDMTGLHREGE